MQAICRLDCHTRCRTTVSQYAKINKKCFYSGEYLDRLPLQQDFIDGEKDQG